MDASPIGAVVVVNEAHIVIGTVNRLGEHQVAAQSDVPAGALMKEGPTTIRPSEDAALVRHRMGHADVRAILITRPNGSLLGALLAD